MITLERLIWGAFVMTLLIALIHTTHKVNSMLNDVDMIQDAVIDLELDLERATVDRDRTADMMAVICISYPKHAVCRWMASKEE